MTNIKQIVSYALSNDSDLLELIPKVRMFNGAALFTGKPVFPYLVFYILNDVEAQQADDEEIESEITIRIDLYHHSSESQTINKSIIWGSDVEWGQDYRWTSSEITSIDLELIKNEVNRVIKNVGFTRNYFQDMDEIKETGIIKHKIGSYTGNFQL